MAFLVILLSVDWPRPWNGHLKMVLVCIVHSQSPWQTCVLCGISALLGQIFTNPKFVWNSLSGLGGKLVNALFIRWIYCETKIHFSP